MPQPNTAPGAQPAGNRGQDQGSSNLMYRLMIGAGMYFGINLLMSWAFAKQQTGTQVRDPSGKLITVPANTEEVPPYLLRPKKLDDGASYSAIPNKIAPIWPMDSHLDIIVTISPSFVPTAISKTPDEMVVLRETRFRIGNYSDNRAAEGTFTVPTTVQNNGTLWGHFYVALSGNQIDPAESDFDPATAYYFTYPLTQYLPKKKVTKTRNLLEDLPPPVEELDEEEKANGPTIANYYHPNTSLSFVPDTGVMPFSQQHVAARQFLHLESTGARDGSGAHSWYYPVLFVNSFWQLRSHMTLLNDTVKTLPIRLDLGNLRAWQFKALAAVELSSKEAARQAAFGKSLPGGGDGTEIELFKEIFIDTNPILLSITAIVSVAHIILETLAFGSDIAHYRKKKDNVGISVRSILANVFMQTVILLYLMDNSQNTSWMILGSQAIGILIELWKVTTVVNVRLRPSAPGAWIPYAIVLEDKTKLTETEEKTKKYDQIAFKYMYIAGLPLMVGYAIYSVIYNSHKSWYSYIITTLVGSVYAYGFLLMVPSLYINYRLKSVAHMPAKAMMYKSLNTFIDDLFAFTIKMPILHRLATFRDDIIFFIYLYQRWVYRVDYSRVNEFGQGGEDVARENEKKAPPPTEAKPISLAAAASTSTGSDTASARRRKGL